MTSFPDIPLTNQWPNGQEEDAFTLNAQIDARLNSFVPRVYDDGVWTTAALLNSWVSYDAGVTFFVPQYRLKAGIVRCRGLMRAGTTGFVAFVLPANLRPFIRYVFTTVANNAGGRIDVDTAGNVTVFSYSGGGSNAFVSLDPIQFPVDTA